jgi:hypothetical protein
MRSYDLKTFRGPMHWCPLLVALVFPLSTGAAERPSSQPAAMTIQRFVEGIDTGPKPMTAEEVTKQLNDPWAVNILRNGIFPTDLDQTLAALTATGKVPGQDSYFVSESGQIPVTPTTMNVRRDFRIVITRMATNDPLPPILISAPAGDRSGFIELMSWDPIKNAFNFYRHPPNTEWTWKGDTRGAFVPATLGKGCFACHLNGVPVMKELKLPWNNWHSQSAGIPPEEIPNEEIRKSLLFTNKTQAEHLEPVVRGWIERATEARIAEVMKGNTIPDAPRLLRPLFATTTVNLATSGTESSGTLPDLNLPPGHFLRFDTFETDLNIFKPPGFSTRVKRPLYRNTLTTFAFRLEQDLFSRKGDTYFAFLVPESAQEDVLAIRKLMSLKVVTRQFVTCVLLVDFSNPVYSSAREKLLQYVPATGYIQDGRSDLPERTASAILMAAASAPPGSPEKQFMDWWNLTPDQLQSEATKQVRAYLTVVQARLQTQEGLNDYTRLAESRRQRFAKSRLNEFELLLPRTNIPAGDFTMKPDGTISP